MNENLSRQDFAEHLNTKFSIAVENGDPLVLELIQADDMGSSERQERFSLVFRGPLDRVIGQGAFNMEHEKLNSVTLFLVPVGADQEGVYYEAAFNRLNKVK